ncbi:uncharacterized protein LOC107021209 isoform X4 [Solanum pennellii]|uniref:Uncharacterized protein LOC107021209 isoform X4 n=1 Tax=Solanum pennellii TaxID=28526 RepID=A0ABM1VCY6_SOLPN|nr:uncharacterized protein LOC107021209 isoform X4 [Solanum pennellii]
MLKNTFFLVLSSRWREIYEKQQPEARDLILRFMEERDSILRQNAKLNRDLELLRHECHERRTGVHLLYILLISLAGILLCFVVRNV